ncbi:Site-specific recombinase XerD [Formosa sp. Hel1_31_208]|uniref:site-specific tyrosine recombinase/integron integrase n=1 Tax=Formosa sp. Hel1_31_208 TaxID=1798225 RepID=UPI00087C3E20|nr:site-specific tyrosine recombinase/integron integrase [Formosa sp. Hel1_31_208]SDS38694.1 Site-specific recombinase XerD [Formosa sp. Hel1_31_208]
MNLPQIRLQQLKHRSRHCIGLKFPYHKSLISLVKRIPSATWSQTKQMWLVDDNEDNLKVIATHFEGLAVIDDSAYKPLNARMRSQKYKVLHRNLNTSQKTLLNDFYIYLKGKRYSKSTMNTYVHYVADFIAFHADTALEALDNRSVERFIEAVVIQRRLSISSQRQFISALKLFIVFEPSTAIAELELTRPKRSRYLPVVLSQDEVLRILQKTTNLKHRTVIAMLYSCGLRISELLHLHISDIDLSRRQIHIRQSKGRKDRYVGLAEISMPLLLNYIQTYEPDTYFIKGPTSEPYSASAVRAFLKRNCQAAGITKRVTPHTLRHSYATHLLEQGVDIRHIQTLLGHSRPETTMIYTHVTRQDVLEIRNPLDVAVQKFKSTDKNTTNVRLSSRYNL